MNKNTNINLQGCPIASIACPSMLLDRRKKGNPNFSGCFDVIGNAVEQVYIKRVLYNDPVVVVWWSDGTTTRAKANGEDKYSPEVGLMYCVLKKISPKSNFDELVSDWLPEQIPMEWKMEYVDIKDVRAKHK